jgi:hypothetical protein
MARRCGSKIGRTRRLARPYDVKITLRSQYDLIRHQQRDK